MSILLFNLPRTSHNSFSKDLLSWRVIFVVYILIFMPLGAVCQLVSGNIYRFAGNVGYVYDNGDGYPATYSTSPNEVGLSSVNYVAVDPSGNVFVSEGVAGCVREITGTSGDISTYAGVCGNPGYTADGSVATSTYFGTLGQITSDQYGNLYITDSSNEIVRVVNASTKIVTTIAGTQGSSGYTGDGGTATSATLDEPSGVAIDTTSGDVYIADTNNCAIRHVTISTGYISTYAGGSCGFGGDGGAATSATLDSPHGLAAQISSGTFSALFIADTDNCRVREVAVSSGNINTYAGGYSYMSSTCGSYNENNGSLATSSQLDAPYSVAIDYSGNLFIANYGVATINEVIASTGVISTVAGTGTSGTPSFNSPATPSNLIGYSMGVAVDCGGNVFIGDTGNNVVSEVSQIAAPCGGGTAYLATTASCYVIKIGAGSGSYSNASGPLTSSGGDATLTGENNSGHSASVHCVWSGFPSVTTTGVTYLYLNSTSSVVGSGSSTPISLISSGSCSGTTGTTASGELAFKILAGTNLSTLSVCGNADPSTSVNSTAELQVGYIHIQ